MKSKKQIRLTVNFIFTKETSLKGSHTSLKWISLWTTERKVLKKFKSYSQWMKINTMVQLINSAITKRGGA